MYLVRRNAPLRGFGVKLNAENDTTMLQDEGFVQVIERSEWKANFVSQIHVHCDNTLVCYLVWCDRYEVVQSVVQVLIIHLTVETGNELENLMKEVIFGW